MTDSRVVVFDLGGVLIDWNPRHLYQKLFSDEQEMEWFLQTVCSPAWNSLQDEGRPFSEAIAELIPRFREYEAQIRAFDERWEETVAGPIEGSVQILERLHHQGIPLYALSNWSAETFPRVRHRFAFLDRFRDIVISGEAGSRKPDSRFFEHFLRRTRLETGNCLFIDDAQENIQAAMRLGFDSILFRSPPELETVLIRRKILPDIKKGPIP